MKTIFIIVHGIGGYGSENKPKIAFERKEDAEVMLDIFKDTTRGELKIVEVPLQPAPVAPDLSKSAKQWLGIGAGVGIAPAFQPNKIDPGIKEPAPEPIPDAVMMP